MINEKLEKLNQEIAKGEARLRRAQHEEKILEHQVKQLNGYNTPTSRKSQEHWDYAQSIAPNIFIGIGKTLGLVEIVLCISLLLLNISTQTTVFAGVVVGIIFLIFGFYKTETGITSKFANKNF